MENSEFHNFFVNLANGENFEIARRSRNHLRRKFKKFRETHLKDILEKVKPISAKGFTIEIMHTIDRDSYQEYLVEAIKYGIDEKLGRKKITNILYLAKFVMQKKNLYSNDINFFCYWFKWVLKWLDNELPFPTDPVISNEIFYPDKALEIIEERSNDNTCKLHSKNS